MQASLMSEIAIEVKKHRKHAGLTQLELAHLAGVGKASVWDIEHGKPTVQFDTLCRILDALNIHIKLESPLGEKA